MLPCFSLPPTPSITCTTFVAHSAFKDMRQVWGVGAASAAVVTVGLLLVLLSGGSYATTLVAARFEGGVVMAADSRTSQGNFVANRLTDKITQVHPNIFLARSGSSAGMYDNGMAGYDSKPKPKVCCCREVGVGSHIRVTSTRARMGHTISYLHTSYSCCSSFSNNVATNMTSKLMTSRDICLL